MRGGISEESYLVFMEQGQSAPCSRCEHENFCRLGYTCQMYRKWEMTRSALWKKDPKQYRQVPDKALPAE